MRLRALSVNATQRQACRPVGSNPCRSARPTLGLQSPYQAGVQPVAFYPGAAADACSAPPSCATPPSRLQAIALVLQESRGAPKWVRVHPSATNATRAKRDGDRLQDRRNGSGSGTRPHNTTPPLRCALSGNPRASVSLGGPMRLPVRTGRSYRRRPEAGIADATARIHAGEAAPLHRPPAPGQAILTRRRGRAARRCTARPLPRPALAGGRAVVVDLDPQGSATAWGALREADGNGASSASRPRSVVRSPAARVSGVSPVGCESVALGQIRVDGPCRAACGIQQPPLRSGSSYPGWRRTRRDPPALSARI